MTDDLSEIDDRIKWCRDRTLILAAEIDTFTTSGAYKISHDVDPETGNGTFYIALEKKPPRNFAIDAGVIIHELRAALDGLACVLAVRNGKGTKNVYFPISRNLAIFESDGIKKKLRNLSHADREVVASLKPYAGGNDMLFALHKADLTRKHTRLILMSGGLNSFGLGNATIERLEFLGGGPITEKKRAFAVASANTRFHAQIGVDLNFSEPDTVRGRPVVATLEEFGRLVQSIVQLFR
ncbi:hypothetical protein KUG85_00225 [Nitratireductor sp. L1-7-SE]|uniref:Uncharacterized protein n=1 Tax=Nitratireductor rhodophyticola TaxID=2854036 RepID=A0ABS7R8N3_9HYPH|nr:hypothetical protein [Nitratireductor rhodophyticola]MBY8915818.1 hypothetical protein [Nitratireductor rhodophyticola]MBY8919113.1 hypothetical protein [Nitratireductor rhodophyticola]